MAEKKQTLRSLMGLSKKEKSTNLEKAKHKDANSDSDEEDAADDDSFYAQDPALMYITKDISKQAYQGELRKKEDKEKRKKYMEEEARLVNQRRLEAFEAQANRTGPTNSYSADLEEALARSMLDTGGNHWQSSINYEGSPRNFIAPNDRQASRVVPSPSNQTSRQPSSSEQQTSLDDPAVQAFMEKRRLKQQKQKEDALAAELKTEASRLAATSIQAPSPIQGPSKDYYIPQAHTAPVVSDNNIYPGLRPVNLTKQVSEPARVIQGQTTTDSSRSRPALTINTGNIMPAPISYEQEQRALYSNRPSPLVKQASEPVYYNNQPVPGIMDVTPHSPAPIVGSSHVMHSDNSIAYKAAVALFKLAKKSPSLHVPSGTSKEEAALQLAIQWITQAAFQQINKNSEKISENEAIASQERELLSPTELSRQVSEYNKLYNSSPSNKISSVHKDPYRSQQDSHYKQMLIGAGMSTGVPNSSPVSRDSSRDQQEYYRYASNMQGSTSMSREFSNDTQQEYQRALYNPHYRASPAHNIDSNNDQYQDYYVVSPPPMSHHSSSNTFDTYRDPPGSWSCKACTLVNVPTVLACEACGLPKVVV